MVAGIFKRLRNCGVLRKNDGVVAVEFALVAVPFFLLLLGIVETSLFFAAGVVLEGASADAARIIRTGQVQGTTNPEETFAAQLCQRVGILIPCSQIQYEVIRVMPNNFTTAADYQPQFDAQGNLISQGFDAGSASEVVLVRTVYKYEFLTPYMGALMTGSPTRNWINLMSTVVIKNEPYSFGS